jgi:hypothetical protein
MVGVSVMVGVEDIVEVWVIVGVRFCVGLGAK